MYQHPIIRGGFSPVMGLDKEIVARQLSQIAASVPIPYRWKEGGEIFLILLNGRLLPCSGRTIFQRSCAAGGSQQPVVELARVRFEENRIAFSVSVRGGNPWRYFPEHTQLASIHTVAIEGKRSYLICLLTELITNFVRPYPTSIPRTIAI